MEFYALLDQVLDLLRHRGRVSYRALKAQFSLDDDHLAALQDELIDAQRLASGEDGKVLVWRGDTAPTLPVREPEAAPLAYTPLHLTEKILTSRSALEGERKQVTVLFADLKGSTELIRDLDPEQARAILDPALHAMMDAVHRYEGTVNQVLGDGIMALFGAPLPERDYTFKHALTHEVAYRSLLQERRRTLHAQIVAALEVLASDRLADQVERLADHAVRGEVWDKALRYCRQAGAKAMERSASREAVGCYEQALAALEHLPEQRDLHEQAIDLRCDLYSAHIVLGQLEHILHALRAAETLAEALNDQRRLGRVSVHMAQYFLMVRQYDHAIASSQRALALAEASGDNYMPIEANNFLGLVYFLQGNYRQAMDANRRAMALLEGERRYERFGQPFLPAVRCRTYLSLCLAEVGAFAEGIAVGEAGLRIAEAVQHPVSLVEAYRGVGRLYLSQGNLHQALPVLERAVGLCEAADLPFFFSLVAPALGAAYVLCGRVDEAVRLLERVLEQTASSGRMGGQAPLRSTLGEAHLRAGRLEAAHMLAARALEHTRTYQERGHEAYALRLLGDIAAHRDPPQVAEADASYRQAMALAEELGMRPLLAHCHLGLGSLYARTGQRQQAHVELAAAIELYRALDMTFWLPQAEAALAQEGQG